MRPTIRQVLSAIKPTRRQALTVAAHGAVLASVVKLSTAPPAPVAVGPPGDPVYWLDASSSANFDDVGDPEYIHWRNRGSIGGGMIIRRDMIKRK